MTREDLLAAIGLALAGDWDGAHGIVQQDEADRTAAWIHAVLHKIEGDSGNARYWYRRCGKLAVAGNDATTELETIRESLEP